MCPALLGERDGITSQKLELWNILESENNIVSRKVVENEESPGLAP